MRADGSLWRNLHVRGVHRADDVDQLQLTAILERRTTDYAWQRVGWTTLALRRQIAVHESAVTQHGVAASIMYGISERRAVRHEGVKLAALAAGIHR